MKDIGRSTENKRIVEMEEEEYLALTRLSIAVQGDSLPHGWDYHKTAFIETFDFTHTFEVILAFYTANYRLNELQSLLDTIKESLNKK